MGELDCAQGSKKLCDQRQESELAVYQQTRVK